MSSSNDYPGGIEPYPGVPVFDSPGARGPGTSALGTPTSAGFAASNTAPAPSEPKIGACTQCRARKVKCPGPNPSNDPCPQCLKHNLECVFESHRRGRKLGSKTMKRKRSTSVGGGEGQAADSPVSATAKAAAETLSRPMPALMRTDPPSSTESLSKGGIDRELPHPLGLLATASSVIEERLHVPPIGAPYRTFIPTFSEYGGLMTSSLAPELAAAGMGYSAREVLDSLPEKDAVSTGLVSMDEAERLFAFFHANFLETTLGLLDPHVHTVPFVRQRSSALFVVVCLLAARHAPWAGKLVDPLRKRLRESIGEGPFLFAGRKSVELVIATLLLSAYRRGAGLQPIDHGWQVLGFAFRMATDIGLNETIHLPPSSPTHLKRLARHRERVWLICWHADRSSSTFSGRKWTIGEDRLVMSVARWAEDPEGVGLRTDRVLHALLQAQKMRSSMFETMPLPSVHEPDAMPPMYRTVIANMWTAELKRWEIEWINESSKGSLILDVLSPIFLAYMRLLLLTRTIGKFGTTDWYKVACACFAHSYDALDTMLNRSPREALRFVDNRVIIMISYITVVMLRFRACSPARKTIYGFVVRVAEVLSDVGNDPPQQDGAAKDFGQLLRQIAGLAQAKDEKRLAPLSGASKSRRTSHDLQASSARRGSGARMPDGNGEEQQPLRSFSEVIASAQAVPAQQPMEGVGGQLENNLDPAIWTRALPTSTAAVSPATANSTDTGIDFGAFDLSMFDEMSRFAGSFVGPELDPNGFPIAPTTTTTTTAATTMGMPQMDVGIPLDPSLAGTGPGDQGQGQGQQGDQGLMGLPAPGDWSMFF